MMNIKPTYYDEFKCIGGQCDFTCCKEWKIAVDDKTASRWKKVCPPGNMKTRRKNLEQFTQYKDQLRVISLENNVCPFLNDEKLCRLVIEYGDNILSETCRSFPREKHEFEDRVEHTLMPCCPEVIDLINKADSFELTGQESPMPSNRMIEVRTLLIDIMLRENMSCEEALLVSFYLLVELQADETLSTEVASENVEQILSAIREMNFDAKEHWAECNELFYDITENYRREGIYRKELDDVMNNVQALGNMNSYDEEFLQKWSSFDILFHKILAQEIYADLINTDSQFEDLVIRLQWIGLEYATIRHISYLKYKKERVINYSQVRTYIVLISRMMGYEEEDIYEYLENSFEDMVWEWGYFALVVGK